MSTSAVAMNPPTFNSNSNTKPANELNSTNGNQKEEVILFEEGTQQIIDTKIGYSRYGKGPNNFLFICGGVGKRKKRKQKNKKLLSFLQDATKR